MTWKGTAHGGGYAKTNETMVRIRASTIAAKVEDACRRSATEFNTSTGNLRTLVIEELQRKNVGSATPAASQP